MSFINEYRLSVFSKFNWEVNVNIPMSKWLKKMQQLSRSHEICATAITTAAAALPTHPPTIAINVNWWEIVNYLCTF